VPSRYRGGLSFDRLLTLADIPTVCVVGEDDRHSGACEAGRGGGRCLLIVASRSLRVAQQGSGPRTVDLPVVEPAILRVRSESRLDQVPGDNRVWSSSSGRFASVEVRPNGQGALPVGRNRFCGAYDMVTMRR
jgi:hypothetical protein